MATKQLVGYAVVDDYGDEWNSRNLAYRGDTEEDCRFWAEDNNFHSASIVKIFNDGSRERVPDGE